MCAKYINELVLDFYLIQVFKRSGGISKRNKKSPKPKRASFASTTPIDIPPTASDSSPSTNTDQVASSSPPPNDRVPTQTEGDKTQGDENPPPTQEGDEPPTRDGLTLELNDPGCDTQRLGERKVHRQKRQTCCYSYFYSSTNRKHFHAFVYVV